MVFQFQLVGIRTRVLQFLIRETNVTGISLTEHHIRGLFHKVGPFQICIGWIFAGGSVTLAVALSTFLVNKLTTIVSGNHSTSAGLVMLKRKYH